LKTIQEHADSFLQKVNRAGETLRTFSQSIESRQEQIKESLLALKQNVGSNVQGSPVPDENKSQIRRAVEEDLRHFETRISAWIELIDRHLDGKEFINQFEKSILLMVFGQVNAGKSTLGNFVAGTLYNGSKIRYGTGTPDFFVYDWAQAEHARQPKMIADGEFKVGTTEETRTIQYYTLNDGLTWVDTPGIHSLTNENEELAKKYVEYADLVLFVTSSSAPGTDSDVKELKRLVFKEKPLLVLITKSDKNIKDQVGDNLVQLCIPKSDRDRSDQEKYVESEIVKFGIDRYMKDRNIVSFSGKLVGKAIETNDIHVFQQSNAHLLYEQISQVINDNTVELKKQRPRKAVNSAIREILEGFTEGEETLDGLYKLLESFQTLRTQLQKSKEDLLSIDTRVFERLKAEISLSVEKKVIEMSYLFDAGQTVNELELTRTIENEIITAFNQILNEQVKKMFKDIEGQQLKSMQLNLKADFQSKYETIEYIRYEVVDRSRNPSGIIEHVQSWFGKKFTESVMRHYKETKQIKTGNNAAQVAEQMIEQVNRQFQPVVQDTIDHVTQQYFSPMETTLDRIIAELQQLQSKLNQLKM
jgi:tRNA U34 5-carboxymethylaminomethyl modifying GTPase MnmE/TrmE